MTRRRDGRRTCCPPGGGTAAAPAARPAAGRPPHLLPARRRDGRGTCCPPGGGTAAASAARPAAGRPPHLLPARRRDRRRACCQWSRVALPGVCFALIQGGRLSVAVISTSGGGAEDPAGTAGSGLRHGWGVNPERQQAIVGVLRGLV